MHSLTFRHNARQGRARRGRTRRARGFTLIELMAVVIIVGILVAIAVPGISHRMREFRSQQAANEIAALYRSAKMRALARGAAVTVRWDGAAQRFTVLESVEPTGAAGCAPRPSPKCQVATTANLQPIDTYSVTRTSDENVVTVTDPATSAGAGSAAAAMDICFSPVGTTRFRLSNDPVTPVSPMTGVAQVTVSRSSALGLTRAVLLLPNGTARVIIPGALP